MSQTLEQLIEDFKEKLEETRVVLVKIQKHKDVKDLTYEYVNAMTDATYVLERKILADLKTRGSR